MSKRNVAVDQLISAMMRLSPLEAERQNVLAFIESCYLCKVLSYDLEAALTALARLSEEEQKTLIEWVIRREEAASRVRKTAA
jgi:hypothetical protein